MISKLSAGAALALLLVALPGGSPQAAPALEVEAALSQATAEVGDVVSLEVRVTARVDGGVELGLPALDGFTELSRSKSEGTSISWNGRSQSVTREHVLVLELQVNRAGRLEVPAITARVGGDEARSRPLALVVGASPEEVDRVPGRVPPPGPDEARLFVRYRVSQGEAWLGQEVLLDLEIFADPSSAFGVEEVPPPPELDGFWREVLEQPQRLEPRAEVVEGRRYQVYRLWRMALYGLEAGERVVPASAIGFSEGRSLLGGGRRLRRKAPPLTLRVKPLPSEGRPRDFAATNVGRFTLAATVDADRVPAGKAFYLYVTQTLDLSQARRSPPLAHRAALSRP